MAGGQPAGWHGCGIVLSIYEGLMPEFQHHQIPEILCMIGFPTAMGIEQLGNYLRPKVTPLHGTRGEKNVGSHFS
jgi:hypothetical protein